MEESKVPI